MKERNVNNHPPETGRQSSSRPPIESLQVEISHAVVYWEKERGILFYTILKPLLLFLTCSCIAHAACSGVTLWDRSWAAVDPAHTAALLSVQQLSHARRVLPIRLKGFLFLPY